jgi:predicted nucleic acid-binding protein
MRAPSATVVVDAAILISGVLGRSKGAIKEAMRTTRLVTTDRVVQEAQRRIELGMGRPDLIEALDALTAGITIVPLSALEPLMAAGEVALRDAVASRNDSTKDAHVLALAWSAGADVWTTDRDLAGTGVATWSTPNLMDALADVTDDD